METDYDRSRIEKLKRGLYSPDASNKNEREAGLSPSDIDVANNWGDTTIVKDRDALRVPQKVGVLKIFVILAVLSALFSASYLLYQYFDPFANPSEKNIAIAFDLPVGTTPGIPVDVVVRVTNSNRVPLEYANLTILYPSGTRSGAKPDQDLPDEKKLFGTIAAGATVEYRSKAIFLGEENTMKELHAVLEYRFTGINSIFTKDEVHGVQILAAPINLSVDALREVNAGQPLQLVVTALSNTVIPLRDVLLKVEYPIGFTFTGAEPKPDAGTNMWRVGTLAPSGKFVLKINGVLSGAAKEEKVFHTFVGVGSDKTARDIGTVYSKALSALSVARPFIGISLFLNGKPAGDVSVPFGTRVEGTVVWQNNLDAKVEQAEIDVKLSGVALNRPSVTAGAGGFYRSSDDTIVWDSRRDPSLLSLESGASGQETFHFQPLPPVSGNQALLNPIITAEVTVRGKRISETGVPEEIKSVLVENVRVSSEVQFASRAVYYVGPFVNSGPIPPQVEKETTYTIIWSIVNTSNSLNNTQVRAVLPVYMKWYGSVAPSGENVVYDRNTNSIVWSPGNIPAGTGIGGKPPREVAFQVVFTPSLSQVKTAPSLLTQTMLTGDDAFSGVSIKQNKNDITTRLGTDPRAETGTDLVVP